LKEAKKTKYQINVEFGIQRFIQCFVFLLKLVGQAVAPLLCSLTCFFDDLKSVKFYFERLCLH